MATSRPTRRRYPALKPDDKRVQRTAERFSRVQMEPLAAGARIEGEEYIPEDMRPAPAFIDDISEPFDLGQCNPDLAGWEVKFNLSAPLAVQELMDEMRSPRISETERLDACKEFLRAVLVGWNFTRKTLQNGQIAYVAIPQPPDGIDRIPLNLPLMKALIDAFGQVFSPDPL